MAPRRPKVKPPKLLFPRDYNVAHRGALFRVYARPLVPARNAGSPYLNKPLIDITNLVESVQWTSSTEEGGAVTGSVTVRNPGNYLGILVTGSKIIVKQANPFLSQVDDKSLLKRPYVPILEMIVQERDKQQVTQTMTLTLGDRLTYLNQGKRDFKFVKKKGKKGPTASYILRKVCTDERIPWTKASIPTTTIEIPKAVGTQTNVLTFFAGVLKIHNKLMDKAQDRTAAGKKKPNPPNWEIQMRTGVLTIRPKRPPTHAWYINEDNFVGEPSYRESAKGFATRVIATGKSSTRKPKKNKDGTQSKNGKTVKKKLTVTVTNEAMASVYGLIVHTEKVSGNITPEKLRRVAENVLAKKSRMLRELSFTCPALPNIWPGSKVYLNLPTYGMKGLFAVKVAEYTVTGTEGPMMNLTVDAGSVSVVRESTQGGKALKVTKVLRPNATTVKVFYAGGQSQTYQHPKKLKIKTAVPVTKANAKRLGRDPVDEVGLVLVTFVKGKKTHEIRPLYGYPKGLVAVTDEGYVTPGGTS